MKPRDSSPLRALAARITEEALSEWRAHEKQGTAICVPHIGEALPTLARVNANFLDNDLAEPLFRQLENPLPSARRKAARLLCALVVATEYDARLIPALIRCLQDSALDVRDDAADALGRIGCLWRYQQQAVHDLQDTLYRGEMTAQIAAGRALLAIMTGSGSDALKKSLYQMARHDRRVRYALEVAAATFRRERAPYASREPTRPMPDEEWPRLVPEPEQIVPLYEGLQDASAARRSIAARRLAHAMRAGIRL